jgi:hypothetical protein
MIFFGYELMVQSIDSAGKKKLAEKYFNERFIMFDFYYNRLLKGDRTVMNSPEILDD